MAIRKYKKPHLCKHVIEVLNTFVAVSDDCIYWRSQESFGIDQDFVFKITCRECKHFELKESEGE